MDKAERAVQQGKTGEARALLFDTGASIKRLRELLDATPALKEDPLSAQLVEQQGARQRQLDKQNRQLIHEQRLKAGWVALPAGDKVLPPTPESACLRIQLLIDNRRMDEAERALDEFAAKHRGHSWEGRAAALRAQVQKQRGNSEAVEQWLAVASAKAAVAGHQGEGPAMTPEFAKELLEA